VAEVLGNVDQCYPMDIMAKEGMPKTWIICYAKLFLWFLHVKAATALARLSHRADLNAYLEKVREKTYGDC